MFMMVASVATQPGFKGWPDCEVCGRPLTQDDGVIEVERSRALQITWARETRHLAMTSHGQNVANLSDVPLTKVAHWRWAHRGCDSDGSFDYSIAADRFDSYAKVIGWMHHLGDRVWFTSTDWYEAIAKAWTVESAE